MKLSQFLSFGTVSLTVEESAEKIIHYCKKYENGKGMFMCGLGVVSVFANIYPSSSGTDHLSLHLQVVSRFKSSPAPSKQIDFYGKMQQKHYCCHCWLLLLVFLGKTKQQAAKMPKRGAR